MYGVIPFTVPATEVEREIRVQVRIGEARYERAIVLGPLREWWIYLVQHTHTDVGYSRPQSEILPEHVRFLDYALAYCEVIGASEICYGPNATDFACYPDCRPDFVRAFEEMANLGTKLGAENGNIRIHAPLLQMTKAEIIKKGVSLDVDYALTHSCYDPIGEVSCGNCSSCKLRKQGFANAGYPDPTHYTI